MVDDRYRSSGGNAIGFRNPRSLEASSGGRRSRVRVALTRRPDNDPGTAPGDRAFRPDIEGLRGIAVLMVVLFHATLFHMVGGYVGVDVFFVISGYVITGLILREQASTGGLSLVKFYGRRAARIVPMALLVLVAAMFAERVVEGATFVHQYADSARWTAIFLGELSFKLPFRDVLVLGCGGTVLSGVSGHCSHGLVRLEAMATPEQIVRGSVGDSPPLFCLGWTPPSPRLRITMGSRLGIGSGWVALCGNGLPQSIATTGGRGDDMVWLYRPCNHRTWPPIHHLICGYRCCITGDCDGSHYWRRNSSFTHGCRENSEIGTVQISRSVVILDLYFALADSLARDPTLGTV